MRKLRVRMDWSIAWPSAKKPGLRLGAGEEGDDRRWDGWMASLTWWTWVWVKSGSWWWTGRPGVLRFMGLQRVGHDWATDLIWSDLNKFSFIQVTCSSFFSPSLCITEGSCWEEEGGTFKRPCRNYTHEVPIVEWIALLVCILEDPHHFWETTS